jgi:hypothetical protein
MFYQTLYDSNGARHAIDRTIYLGVSIDADPDGQPNFVASGDDFDGNDDEDGVFFTTYVVQGYVAMLSVGATGAGYFSGWVDFNNDGDWDDIGEHVFADQPLAPGVSHLFYQVPMAAVPGFTYARFRFSRETGLNYYGCAKDGEVEDYLVQIMRNTCPPTCPPTETCPCELTPTMTPTNTPTDSPPQNPTDPPTETPTCWCQVNTSTPTNTPTGITSNPDLVVVDASATGNGVDLFNTIQEGVNGVAADGRIVVRRGVYREHVVITKDIALVGRISAMLIGDGQGAGITVDGANTAISHLRIQNFEIGIDVKATGSACVRYCNILENSLYGMKNDNSISSCCAKYNWWGDVSGPDDDPGIIGGLGDRTSDNLDVSSFMETYCLSDSDGDAIPDADEDANGNGIADAGETNPFDKDTDGDGVEDGVELALGSCPVCINSVPSNPPGTGDTDGDGFKDFYEVAAGCSPDDPDDFPALGDINGSGSVSNTDALIISSISLGNTSIAGFDPDMMDVNRDGTVNYTDATILFNWVIGKVQSIP